MDARSFRQVMGRFPTGVAVVTARDGEALAFYRGAFRALTGP